ncbi:MAG TPA: hypothetical protein VK464_27815 [Symbiobacteriaceae bacterium]|jgi:hypothetical protein|nr:hypothetical protein [Symbiobacteriaceae bacterium]
MRWIHIPDTSIMVCLLNLPEKCNNPAPIWDELERYAKDPPTHTVVLPVATIIETGNHIAHRSKQRHEYAMKFAGFLNATALEKAPWVYGPWPYDNDLLSRLAADFPPLAAQGVGGADTSLIATFNRYIETVPNVSVRIWSLDTHLKGYVYQVPEIGKGKR